MFEKVLEAFQKYPRIILHRHTNPDGDAIGAQVGLKHLLLHNLHGKEVFMVGDAPARYAFMDDSTPDIIPDKAYKGALAVILDTSAPALIADDRYKLADATIRLDHHLFIEQIADLEVIDTTAESCAGLLTSFAMECGWEMPRLAARSLYTGMMTDSGRFRYDSVTAETFRRAAFLMEAGIETESIFSSLYADDLKNLQLRAAFTLKIQKTEAPVAYIYTTREEFEQTGESAFAISRGMVGIMADLRGIDIWVNFTETESGVLAELRSSKYNINPIAVKYGGGGHAKASGATLRDREEAMRMLADLIKLTESEEMK